MKRPEKNFWMYVILLSSIMLVGLSGQLISCANAKTPEGSRTGHHHSAHHDHYVPAPWNQPGPSVQSTAPVKMTAQLDRTAIMHRGDGVVRVEVNVEASSTDQAAVPPPSDIVVVVDTSGSMEGEKLRYAKEALHGLINRLRPDDRFGLIEYSDSARVLVHMQSAGGNAPSYFHNIANGLRANGSTNMSAGLDRALNFFPNASTRSGRVILLSDGLANAGDSSFHGLNRRAQSLTHRGIALSTMGVGVDFDENVMTALATSGTGGFYYIAKLEFLSEFLDAELRNTRGTYAHSAELRVAQASGVQLLDAMGLPTRREGGATVVTLGTITANRPRTVWLTLRVPSHTLGSLELGSLSLRYKKEGHFSTVSIPSLPRIACLDDRVRYEQSIDRPVWERGLLNDQFHRTREEFGEAIRTGDRKQIHSALGKVEQERALARRLGSKKVIAKLDELKSEAREAEQAQRASAPERNRRAKASKARGYQMRNKDSYEDADALQEAYY